MRIFCLADIEGDQTIIGDESISKKMSLNITKGCLEN
jgi:hypothetical protein